MSFIQGPQSYKATLTASPVGPVPQNSPIEFVLAFMNEDGTMYDPASLAGISITVEDPTAASTTYTSANGVSKYSPGVYAVEVEVTKAGNWLARGQGPDPSGNLVTSLDTEITVLATEVT
jgi:hypothetical protein